MQEVSQKFNDLWSTPGKLTDVKFTINDVEYLNDAIYPSALSRRMFANDEPAVGSVVQSTFSSSVVLKSDIPKHATVKVYNRVVHPDNGEASEWIRRGEFYINSRRGYTAGSVLEFAAKDAIGKTNKSYKDYTGFTSWPQNENAVVAEIAQIIGVTVDVRTVLAGYSVPYPNDYTMREILGYIAAANGGNWTITDVSTLRLVKLTGNADDLNIGNRAASFVSLGDTGAYTGVTIWWDDDNAFSAGNDSGTVLECDCPWATQTMADNLLLQVSGLSLRAYTASLTDVSPAAELGDVVIIDGVRCVLNDYDVSLDGTHQPNILSPALSEADEDYEPELQRQMRRAVKLGQSYYGTKITREDGLVIEKTDGQNTEASVTLNADELAFKDGNGNDVLYYDREKGTFVFDGSLGADAVFTDSLYAEQGNVADLTVNRLDTGDYIKRYFTRDISDLNHIQILSDSSNLPHIYLVASSVKKSYEAGDGWERLTNTSGEALYWTDELMTTVTLESTEYPAYIAVTTLTNPYGEPVYWSQDISEATITDGYPYIDGTRVYTTATNTGYPVTIWDYASQNKADLTFVFNSDSGYYEPRFVLGAGDQLGTSKGYIYKGANGLDIRYDRSNQRGELSIHLNDSGEITKSLTDSGNTIQGAVQGTLVFENVSVTASSWTLEATPTFASYPYAAVLTCTGATSAMGGEVIFSPDDVESGKLASAAKSDTDTVTIYATEPMTITVLRIELRF